MTQNESKPSVHPEAPPGASRRRRRPPRQAFDALILLAFAGLIGYGVYRYYQDILEALYTRTAMVVLVVVIVEFLILKSFDRTRLFRIENNRLVRRRMADLQALREAESALASLIKEPPMAPTEVLRRRQLKGSMIDEDDEEEDPNKTPFPGQMAESLSQSKEGEETPEPAPSSTFTPSAGAFQNARRTLRHIRKRIY